MNSSETNRIADLIWSTLNSISNENLSKEEQIELIKPIISGCASASKIKGRREILNVLEKEINNLRENDYTL